MHSTILLLCSSAVVALANPMQFHFSPRPSSRTLSRLSFASRQALYDSITLADQSEADVWSSSYNATSRSWELLLVSDSNSELAAATSSPAATETLIPSIEDFLAEPSQDPKSLALLSTASVRNLTSPSFPLDDSATGMDSTIHDTYHPFDNVGRIFDHFEARWGHGYIRKETLGKSWQGRQIDAWTVSRYRSPTDHRNATGSEEGEDKGIDYDEEDARERMHDSVIDRKKRKAPKEKIGVVIYGALHSREWISTSTAIYLAHFLLESHHRDKLVRDLLDRVEFTFVPIVNPDGYAHTWTSLSNRLWRKSRQPPSTQLDAPFISQGPELNAQQDSAECVGIDLNKNWDHNFSASKPGAICSDSYAGATAFESIELVHLSQWLLKTGSKDPKERGSHARVRAVLDLHSFGEQLLYPYSSDCSNPPPSAENLFECLLAGSKALKSVHGRSWQVGESCQVGIKGGGEGLDWIYDKAKIPWSFTAQLRGGVYGFLLPPTQIRASGEEFAEALKAIAKFIVEKEK